MRGHSAGPGTEILAKFNKQMYIPSLSIWRGLARLFSTRFSEFSGGHSREMLQKLKSFIFEADDVRASHRAHFKTSNFVPRFTRFTRMFHLCFHHFNSQSNIIAIVPILDMRM